MRKVAIVTQDLRSGGGVATMVAFLQSALAASGEWQPEIVSLATASSDECSTLIRRPGTWRRGVRAERGRWRGIPYVHVGARWVEIESQRYRPRRELDDVLASYDVVHFVTGSAAPVVAAQNVRRPLLLWAATTIRADRESRLNEGPLPKRWWLRLMLNVVERQERVGLRMAQHVFALSDYTHAALKKLGARAVTLAPCGVDTGFFQPADELGQAIVCVARLYDARKNVPLLLRAYQRLRSRLPACPKLLLVGQPPSPATVAMLSELALQDHVEMMGPQSPTDLAALYRSAGLFALSSDEEGLGIVILEAMASGLPVVSTDCGGPSTLVRHGENGFLTKVGDAEALAEAMQQVIANRTRAEAMGRRAREIAVMRFSNEAIGRVFLDRYRQMVVTA